MAEKAQRLQADTQIFRDIFTASPVGITVENLEGQPLFVNPALCSMLGLSEEEMCGGHCIQLSPPEDAEKDWALFQQLRAGSIDHYQLERRYFRKDGSLFWGRLSLSLLKGRSSPLVVARVEDITDERRADEALRASEERLRLAQQAAHIGTFEWNTQTGVNSWTPELEAVYGLPPGSFGGTQTAFENLVHPDDRARVIELNRWALKTGQPAKGEWRVVWPDGSVHWISGRWQVFMTESGEPSRMIGINGDVTERKLAEEALRESEQRLRLATQAGRMYTYDWDVTTDAVMRSPEHTKILGLAEPLRFPQQQFVDRIHPDDRPKFLGAIVGLTPENPTGEVIYRALASDGTLVWLKSNGRGFFDAEGRLLRVIGMVADISDLKRAEEALAGMTRKLIESQEQERARIGREIHDDITQRLALLAIELEQLQQNPSEVESRVPKLREEACEVARDVEALSHELHSSKLEYLGIVGAARNFCKEVSERQKVEIDFRSHDLSPALPTNVSLSLFRVLQEALRNATMHSGVKRFEVRLWGSSGETHLTVSDLGAGFDTEAALKSTGLGLTSMQERLRLVHGELSIKSQPKGGTTIHARIPFDSTSDSARAAG
jgi:PAS domain S-box-containing protein